MIAFKISFVLFKAVQFSKRKLAKLVELQNRKLLPLHGTTCETLVGGVHHVQRVLTHIKTVDQCVESSIED